MTDEPYIGQTRDVTEEVSLLHNIHMTKKQKNGKLTVKITGDWATNFIRKWLNEWLYFDEEPMKL